MSSGTRYDPGSVRKLIGGMASKLTSGGSKVEDPAAALQRISRLGMSPRQMMLNRLWAHYRCEQYAARKVDWNGREIADPIEHEAIAHAGSIPPGFYDAGENYPIKFRKPTAPYALAKVIVDRFTGLLFSKKHHPTVRMDGDPETEDFIQALIDIGRLWPQMIQARIYGGAMGSVAIGFQFVDGQLEFEVHDPRWLKLDFKDRATHELKAIEKRYMVPEEEVDLQTGLYVTNWYWYRRVITDMEDVLFAPAPVDDGTEPLWVPERVVKHGFGFCPVVWVQNLPVQDDVDGDPDALGIYDMMESIDALIAQANKGVLSNCDPTVVISTDAQMADVKKGSDNAIKLPSGSSANYLEITGSGPTAALSLAEQFRKWALEVAQCVLEHPDVTNRTATEIERVYSSMITKADVMREQYGEKAIKPLIQKVLKAVRSLQEGVIDEGTGQRVRGEVLIPPKLVQQDDGSRKLVERKLGKGGGVLRMQWPKYFEMMLSDVELATRSAIAAKTGRLVDQEHAVQFVAEHYRVDDVPEMMRNIEREHQEEEDRMAQAALGMLQSPGVPTTEPGGE